MDRKFFANNKALGIQKIMIKSTTEIPEKKTDMLRITGGPLFFRRKIGMVACRREFKLHLYATVNQLLTKNECKVGFQNLTLNVY